MQDYNAENDPLIGKILGEKYKITKRLGAGGMATVYKATQITLGREIALKIIHPNLVNDNESISRFYREARDLATLSHPNIVTVYDFGTEAGLHYISMEYLQGKTLSEIIRQEGRLDELKIVKYIAPIADALNHLHENGLIHRDIKSSNIFITSTDRPLLMDFGIAYHQDKTISLSGAILGTVEYMSPEQARGEAIDARSDFYSLGVVMYEAITGRVPFHTDSPTSTLFKVVNDPPPPILEDVAASKDLRNLVLSTLEKDKGKRPQKGSTIYDALNSIITLSEIRRRKIAVEDLKAPDSGAPREEKKKQKKETKKTTPQSSDKGSETGKPPRRKAGIFIVLGVILLAVAAGGYYYFTQMNNNQAGGKNPAADNSPLFLQAKQAYSANDFVAAHRDLIKVVALNPKNTEARQLIKDCILKLSDQYIKSDMVAVPAGTFVMGNDAGGGDEKPQHPVTLSSFQLSKTEITNRQFVVFLNAIGCSPAGTINDQKIIDLTRNKKIVIENGIFKTPADADNLPVTGVTWTGADMFCKTFSGRLPTEAEWEYSAMGGTNNVYSGSDDLNEIAWYKDNSSGQLNNVAIKKPNSYGIYDLTGNVWEWCNDFYSKTYYKSSAPLNPMGPETGNNKVIRGGDYMSLNKSLSNKYRSNSNIAGTTGDVIGFRLCIPSK